MRPSLPTFKVPESILLASTPALQDPQKGYAAYLDVPDTVDYFLVTEMTKNPDGYRGSIYMFKDAGPEARTRWIPWDYNEAFGRSPRSFSALIDSIPIQLLAPAPVAGLFVSCALLLRTCSATLRYVAAFICELFLGKPQFECNLYTRSLGSKCLAFLSSR